GGAACPGSGVTVANLQGSGIAVNLPVGGSLTFTVTATVAGGATGSIINSATIAPPAGTSDPAAGNNTASDTDTINPVADLSITKTDGVSSVNAGGSTTYTLTLSNGGPSAVAGALLTDPAVANLTVTGVSCSGGSGGASCPGSGVTVANLQGSGISVSLPSGGSMTFTVMATVSSGATGSITNTATLTAPGGTTDPTPGNNSASDTDAVTPVADLSITKTDGVTSINAGGTTTYTLVVSNAGPSATNGALLTDPAVANLNVTNVTCTNASGGAACPGAGVTVANLQGSGISVNLPANSSLTFSVAATVSGSATGSIINTATIAVPGGTVDPTPGNNSASDTDTITPVADLSITKTDGVTSVNAGGTTTYTLVISNAGPSTATGALLTDPAVTNLSVTNVSCTGGTGGAACPGGGVTVANLQGSGISLNLPSGGSLTFTVTATVAGSATGSITNTATISAPAGTSDPTPGNNSASDTDTVTPVADLSVTKTDGVTSVNAGGTTTYTLVISNAGPSAVTDAALTDPAVTNLTVTVVNCSGGTGGATCPASGVTVANLQGSGIGVNLPAGSSLTFTVIAAVAGSATGSITNTATITLPSGTIDPTPGNNTASDTDTVTPVADLSVTKTDGVTSVNAGGTTTYTLTIQNSGPSAVTSALLTDPAVTSLTVTSVNCTGGTGGATCPASGVTVANLQGSGISVNLPSGGTLTFTVAATIAGSATDSLTNTATITPPSGTTDPTPGNNTASDTDTITPVADLSITKSDGVSSVNAGGTTTYTLVISNAGPSAVTGATLTDPAVTNLTVTSVNCTNASGGAACPGSGVAVATLQGSGISVNLPSGSSLTFTVAANVAGGATGSLTNTATITVPSGTTDPTPGNNTTSDTDTIIPVADLSITKTDGVTSVNAGGTTTYTLVISNAGPSTATGALLTDPAVAKLTVTNVACTTGTGGASCPASGVMVANLQGSGISVNLPSGSSLPITVTATVIGSATGSVTNTATITAPVGTTDPTPANNSASDTDTITPVADLSITKTDGVTSINAGGTTTYTLVVSNAGPSAVTGAALTDPAVTNLTVTSVNCGAVTGGAVCPASGVTVANLQGSGISLNLPANSSMTFTVGATVASSATGNITNTTAIAAPSGTTDPTPGNNTASDTDVIGSLADLSITKTDGVSSVLPGSAATYTLVISNAGPSAVTGATLTDPVVTNLTVTNVTCTNASGGAACPGSGVTVANLQGSGISLNLPAGASLTFTVAAAVSNKATGSLTNTATITPPIGTTDPTPSNNSASDTNVIILAPTISKAFGVASLPLGGSTSLSFTLTNPAANTVALTGVGFTDTLPTGLVVATPNGVTGSCGGGTITATAGTGSISLAGATLGVNSSCTFGVNVNGTTAGIKNNTTGNVTSTNGGQGNTATATTTVVAPSTIAKAFASSNILLNGTTGLSFTLTNPNATVALTGVAFNDPLPAGLVVANPANLNGACGGAVTANAGAGAISLAGGTIAANSSCTISVNVTGTTVGTKNNTTSNITSTNGGQGNTASATLNVGNLSASITDPVKCLGPGGIVGVSASVTNGAAVAQSVSLTASLPAQLLALPGTCTATAGTCTVVNASTMTFSATLAAGQTATINYQAQVADGTPSGAQLCVNSAVSFSGGPPTNVQACTMVNCQPVGPGLTPPVLASDQTAGSVLVYNFYSSSATSATAQNTRINLTNIHQVLSANVHMFFLDGAGCSVADKYICLTPNQTASFLASDIDPGTTGYLVAVAVDRTGCPINFNYLIGDEYVKLTTGHAANLGAEAFSALAGSVTPCDANATAAVLNFDGVSYARAPRVLALDNIADRTSGNDTLLVLNRFGGNLAIGASTLSTLTGVLYDDAEKGFSFGFNGSGCQFLSSLSNNFPRTAPRFEQIIPAGRSGWLKLWLANEGALLGAAINANRNAAAAASAFNQGHNLHKLTLTTAAQLTIPVFPPSC
ncbi:MAG: DUF11 domain-containing protein, partial [Acidobacteria bacterium]|nr:DUF11 domain-containing protein [Acidobacteriota bacterium]